MGAIKPVQLCRALRKHHRAAALQLQLGSGLHLCEFVD
jgi:hypothetical protein